MVAEGSPLTVAGAAAASGYPSPRSLLIPEGNRHLDGSALGPHRLSHDSNIQRDSCPYEVSEHDSLLPSAKYGYSLPSLRKRSIAEVPA